MAHFGLLKVSVLLVFATTAQADLRGYDSPPRDTNFGRYYSDAFRGNGRFSGGNGRFSGGNGRFSGGNGRFSGGNGRFTGGNDDFLGGNTGSPSNEIPKTASLRLSIDGCPEGQARKADGLCAKAQITRNLFVYKAPPVQQVQVGPAPDLPDPKVHYNFVFVRTPEVVGASRPVVVPPPQQKTLVYVLSRRPGVQDQEMIEMPSTTTKPEVYFVNYVPGDNPVLPGGITLQQALSHTAKQGPVIDGGADGAGGGPSGVDLRGVGAGISGRNGASGRGSSEGGLFSNEDTDEGTLSNTRGGAVVPDVTILRPEDIARGTGREGFERSNEAASSLTGSVSVPMMSYSTPV